MFRQSSLELSKVKDIWGKGITLIKTLKLRYKRRKIFLHILYLSVFSHAFLTVITWNKLTHPVKKVSQSIISTIIMVQLLFPGLCEVWVVTLRPTISPWHFKKHISAKNWQGDNNSKVYAMSYEEWLRPSMTVTTYLFTSIPTRNHYRS